MRLGIAEMYRVAVHCTVYVQLRLGIAVRSAGVMQCTARFIGSRGVSVLRFMGSAMYIGARVAVRSTRAMRCTVGAGGCGEVCGAYAYGVCWGRAVYC